MAKPQGAPSPAPRARTPGALLACLACAVLAGACSQAANPKGPKPFVVLMDAAPKGFDPRFATSDASAKIGALVFAGLVTTDTPTGRPALDLAESIAQPEPLVFDVTLRAGLVFHDGTPLTSEDVRYTFMELDSPLVQSPLAEVARRIAAFEVRDARRFRITLGAPHAAFMADLGLGIVPRHRCEGRKDCAGVPLGAGPYRWGAGSGEGRVELEAFRGHWAGSASLERLSFRVVRDDNTRLLAMLGGSADLAQNAVPPVMLPVVERAENLEVTRTPSFKYTYLAFNMRHPILGKAPVREAIAHAIDREAIIRHRFSGAARLATGMLAPEHWAYEPEVARFDFDPERARALLDAAGHPDPDGPGPQARFALELKVSSNKFRRSVAELIARQLRDVGIDVRVRAYEWGTFFQDVKSGNFAMTTLQWPSVQDPGLYRWAFHSRNIPSPQNLAAGANRGGYRNPTLDALLDAAEAQMDPGRRAVHYREVQRILATELPYVSLWHEDNIAVVKRGTRGYRALPNARYEGLRQTQMAP